MSGKRADTSTLTKLMKPSAIKLLSASGSSLVKEIGIEVVRGVILDVLTGKNLRDSTEVLTRRRITELNLATFNLFLKGASISSEFVKELPQLAGDILLKKGLSKAERWLAQWTLGLTDKAFQNVLRDDSGALAEYRDRYVEACSQIIKNHEINYGSLSGTLKIDANCKAEINWLFMAYLLNTVGAQTLAIRGSEKSAYGKLFEKFILGSLLHILDFKYIEEPTENVKKVFWLSSRAERRESDATLIYQAGKGIRFDIGFIGRGNPEISLDKVTRFEREIQLGRQRYYMATIILVDRIGERSRIGSLAKAVNGTIIQMSAGYWPQKVAEVLHTNLGYNHDLIGMKQSQIGKYLKDKLQDVPIEKFISAS